MGRKIVIAEDDESIRRLLEVALKSHGYTPVGFPDAVSALEEIRREPPGLVIFDVMMDGMDGFEAVARLRQDPRTAQLPVILLTAKSTEVDKIIGLDAGADDYVTKPFSVLELCARVRAQLRRTENTSAQEALESGGLCLHSGRHEVFLDGVPVSLTPKEYELLKILMENRDRVISRTELLRQVWGSEFCGETRTLDIHIGTLRQKLGDSAEQSRYIKTVRGVGYRFDGGGAY
ncbi:MAG: response regulator transcription factor [Oscillospiraceae bacterium]|nr:response regulator transcription factor [Oscillospiraceae bacterium]